MTNPTDKLAKAGTRKPYTPLFSIVGVDVDGIPFTADTEFLPGGHCIVHGIKINGTWCPAKWMHEDWIEDVESTINAMPLNAEGDPLDSRSVIDGEDVDPAVRRAREEAAGNKQYKR